MREKAHLFALVCSGLLPRILSRLLERLKSAENVWKASPQELRDAECLTPKALEKFLIFRGNFSIEERWRKFEKSGIHLVSINDQEYPELLKMIFDPPLLLFYQGRLEVVSKPSLAVVGSRLASQYGKLEAGKIAQTLAGCGFTIVSGLARGIDMAAHRGALAAKGKTVAVLGSGIDRIYPPENESLARRIAGEGAVVSEFPPGTPPEPWNFPRRNRIISGLSLGIVVVEAREKSGALITAKFALEQGREVFALPGRPETPSSKGSNALIQDGAKLVQEIGDILEEFSCLSLPGIDFLKGKEPSREAFEDRELSEVLKTLSKKEGSMIEDLVQEMKVPVQKIIGTLTLLEAKGLVCRLPGNLYVMVKTR